MELSVHISVISGCIPSTLFIVESPLSYHEEHEGHEGAIGVWNSLIPLSSFMLLMAFMVEKYILLEEGRVSPRAGVTGHASADGDVRPPGR